MPRAAAERIRDPHDNDVTSPGEEAARVNPGDSAPRRSWRSRTRRLRDILGIDRAIFYTIIARGWSALAGPISLFFVARFLGPEEQGFYYTFSSVLALQVFFELGLAYVIMQSVSHEKAHLEWTSEGLLGGDPVAKARLASLLRLSLKWYLVVASGVTIVLVPAGFWFFAQNASAAHVDWQIPWLLVAGLTALNLIVTPFIGVWEGCGRVSEITGVQVRQAVFGSLTVWAAFGLGFKLYAAPLISLVSITVALSWLLRRPRGFFLDLLTCRIAPGGGVSWRSEVLPFQWKIALSWLSSYFIFHLANPVLFRYHGAVEAGRMGMTMRIIDSIIALSVAWISTKSAPFGSYIAKREFEKLDAVFWKAFRQSVGVAVCGGATFLLLYYLLAAMGATFLDRLLDPVSIALLAGNAVTSCVILNQAVYLRAHKQEPFLWLSILAAVQITAIMFLLGRPYGGRGIALGLFCGGICITLPLATLVFYKKRREWH